MNEYQSLLQKCKQFAHDNVVEGSREILEYHKTSILKNTGVVRLCGLMLAEMIGYEHTPYKIAEILFRDAALEIVSKLTKDQIDGLS